MAQGFVHLHNHTDFSMLDGAARVDDLISEAKAQGMPAIATTERRCVRPRSGDDPRRDHSHSIVPGGFDVTS